MYRNIDKYPYIMTKFRGEQWSLFRSDEMVIFFLLEPLASMVFRWFLGYSTITTNWFSAPRPLLSRVFDGFGGIQPFQWFSMVMDHWTNDAMVSMDRSPLNRTNSIAIIDNGDRWQQEPSLWWCIWKRWQWWQKRNLVCVAAFDNDG